jgi:archaellum biogenesis ATPase FlaH
MGNSTLRIIPRKPPMYLLPNPELEATSQSMDAHDLIESDKSGYPRFRRLAGVHALTGALAPGELLFVLAREGSGKSLFCQNFADDLIEQGVNTLYLGTEQEAKVLRVKHACIRAGVSPRSMLKPDSAEMQTTAWTVAKDAVREELRFLREPAQARRLMFANEPYVDREVIAKWVDGGSEAFEFGCVIVDHIDQVSHGDGRNAVQEATETIQLLHELARAYEIPIVIASQVKRTVEPMKRYSPPEASDAAGTSGKERTAALMLGLWRPLRNDLPFEELREILRQAKRGGSAEDKVYQPNTMGVRLLKDRLGTAPGKQCMLHVGRGGRLEDDHAETHGIRTTPRDFGERL